MTTGVSSNEMPIATRWTAIALLYLTALMSVLDSAIVTVAIPTIQRDLGFSETSVVWVINAYLLPYAGLLMLSGRIGDLFCHRRVFLSGVSTFTLGSLLCGLAGSAVALLAGRAAQGVGGAFMSTSAFGLVMTMFKDTDERTKVLGLFGCVNAGGQTFALIVGGLVSSTLGWHWLFLVNFPIGLLILIMSQAYLPTNSCPHKDGKIDTGGAVTITVAVALALFSIEAESDRHFLGFQTLASAALAALFFLGFLFIESRADTPLIPPKLFRTRNFVVANLVSALMSGSILAWDLICTQNMQLVLGYSQLRVAIAFIPSGIMTALFSAAFATRRVSKVGYKTLLLWGLISIAAGLMWLACTPFDWSDVYGVFPAMLFIGFGSGIASTPLLLAALAGVAKDEAGISTGILTTSSLMGGMLGLAIAVHMAATTSESLRASGRSVPLALSGGFHMALLGSSLFVVVAAIACALFLHEADAMTQGRGDAGIS